MGTLGTWDKACDGPWEMINVHYRVTWRGGQAIDDRWSLPTRFQPRNLSSIHAQLGRLVRAWRGDQPWGQLKVVSSLAKIISGYWSEHAHVVANERRDDLVEAARDWLDTHPLIAYDARGLARTIGLSVSQLNRRFRLAVGTSPKSYWQQQRLARCRIELRHSPRTLKSLATDLGFSDVYYFCRWFRQQTGTTPGTFRRGPLDPAL
jgi:AraC-like DNA-binding protein